MAKKPLRVYRLLVYLILLILLIPHLVPMVIFHPGKTLSLSPLDIGLDYEDIHFKTSDGLLLHGWYIPAENARASLLFFHGNAGNIGNRLESIETFHNLGLSVFIFDYRGYGKSEGNPTIEGTHLDALAAWRWLVQEKNTPPEQIVVFGRSLGGAIAMDLMKNDSIRPKALILESTFASLADMTRLEFLSPLTRLLIGNPWDSEAVARTLTLPTLVIHSPKDEIVPYRQGKKLFNALAGEKIFFDIQGGHNEGFSISATIYEPALNSFLTQYFGKKREP